MVTVRVNPTCTVYWSGAQHGAGPELQMPDAIAHEREKAGAVMILNAPRKRNNIEKENGHAGA